MSRSFPVELMAEATGRPTSIEANEPPGHDIFCTPENNEFLSKFTYDDLDNTGREIRLLKILPDSGSGFVECELLPSVKLASMWKQYRALSYCAGDAHNTIIILVNGTRCNVFANLHHALMELLLWVDQICINQANLAERSHQVGFMRDIYRYAEQTFICLSTAGTEGQGLKWLVELWRTMFEEYIHWTQTIGELLREFLRLKSTRKPFMKGLAGFCDVLGSPWWERAWVFQEFSTSTLPTFLLGHDAISLAELTGLLPELCTLILEILFGPDNIYKPQFLQELRRTHHHPSQVREAITVVLRMLLAATEWRKTSDLKLLLMHTQKSRASDCRDKIYSMISLAYPGYGIVPNYSTENSPDRLLVETTRRIITFENNLEVLSYLRRDSSRSENEVTLPSWVVDWFRNDNTPVVCSVNGIETVTIGGFVPHHLKGGYADTSFPEVQDPQDPHNKRVILEAWAVFLDDNFTSSSFPGRYLGSRGCRIRSASSVKDTYELWVLCGALEPFILESYSFGYRIVTQVECEDLLGDLDEGRFKEFSDDFGDLDTEKMERRHITIL
ncbi:hypothetical protein FGRMN_1761 [Fusarium graminum]|nr:hypothetical protein FGRMN_1761 [Fusarium graminum]